MHGREFVSGPPDIPYPAFHLTGSTYVDLDIITSQSDKFSIAALVYLESTDTAVLYEYTDNRSRLVFRMWIDAGYLKMRSFESNGMSWKTLEYNTNQMPEKSWFQITINIDKTVGTVQVMKNNIVIMVSDAGFLPLLDALSPSSLRVGKSLSEAMDSLKGRVTCVRVFTVWTRPFEQAGLQRDCDYRTYFPFMTFSGNCAFYALFVLKM